MANIHGDEAVGREMLLGLARCHLILLLLVVVVVMVVVVVVAAVSREMLLGLARSPDNKSSP